MSHIDEGELTAYADGAYAPESAEAQRLRAHLATCANCRNRLADAQALSARAGALLELATPAAFEVPAFEELHRRAGATARKQRGLPLAWAATIVLAVGLGWLSRGWLTTAAPERLAVSAAPKSAPPSAVTQAPAAPPDIKPGPTTLTERQTQGVARPSERSVEPLVQNEPQAVAAAPAATPAAAPPAADLAGAARKSEPEYITAAEAERRGIKLHIVPELEVLRIALRPDTAVIEQKLPDAKVLTITQTLAVDEMRAFQDAATSNVARTQPAQARAEEKARVVAPMVPAQQKLVARDVAPGVVVTRDGARVWLVAPVSVDSLRALAAQIH